MKYKVEGRAKLSWHDKTTDSLQNKYQDIVEYVEGGETLTTEEARNIVENLEIYKRYIFQWVTMIKVSAVE